MTVQRADTFAGRTVATGWGTASDGHVWTIQSGDGQSVASNEGVISNSTASTFATLGSALAGADAEGLVRFSLAGPASDNAGILLRWTDASNHWLCRYNSATGTVVAMVKISGTYTTLSPGFTITLGTSTFYWLRFRVQGTTISFKIWQDGTSEPGAWSEQYTNSSQNVAGAVGLYGFANSANDNHYDTFSVDDLVTNVSLAGTLTPTDTLAGGLTGVPVTLAGTLTPSDTAGGNLTDGTSIGGLTVTTKSQSWSGGPTGSPGTETDVTYTDGSNSGWSVGIIPTYGGATISPWYEVDGGVTSANQTSLTTSIPDGKVHLLEQALNGVFDGSEGHPYTLSEQGPATGTSFRRYYSGSYGPDANGFNWTVSTCIYPGDPGFIAYRFDITNPNGTAIQLAPNDSLEFAIIGGLQQADTTWSPANGGYGTLAGGDTVGWPSGLTVVDPDYMYIVPAVGSGLSIGVATIKQKAISAYSPPWANPQIQYLQNTSRLKVKLQGDLGSFPANTTATFYLLSVLRRQLTATDVRAMTADYQHPGTPTGPFTSFSYDERAFVFASAGTTVTTTLDLAAAALRFKPILKLTGWTNAAAPLLTWGGTALVAGTDYRSTYDAGAQTLYLQLYFDVIPTGGTPTARQRANAALVISPPQVALAGTLTPSDTVAATLTPPAATLAGTLAASDAVAGTLAPPAALLTGALTPTDSAAATLTPPAATLTGTLSASDTAAAASGLIPPAAALAGTLPVTETAAGTLSAPAAALAGTLSPTDTLAGALTPAPVALAGTLAPVETLAGVLIPAAVLAGTLTPADTLVGNLIILAVTLAGTLQPTEVTAGTLTTPDAPLAGALTPTDTLAGALSGAAVTLAGVILASDALGGALLPPAVTFAATLTPMETVAGTLTTPNAPLAGTLTPSDAAAGTVSAPAVALSGTVAATDTLVGALSGAAVVFTGTLTPTESVAGALSPPAVTLSGLLTPVDSVAGTLSALVSLAGTLTPSDTAAGSLGIALSGTLTPTETVAGVLTTPAVALSGTLLPTDAAAGALASFLVLAGTLTPTDMLTGVLRAGARRNNEAMTTDNVLLALSVVLPQGTQQAVAGGSITINDDSAIVIDAATWPCLLIMEGAQDTMRISARTWQKKLTIYIFYLRGWGDSTGTNDAIWADINADMERMIANLADNPTLTCVLPGSGAATRNCLEVVSAEPSPRTKKVVDYDTYRAPVVQRMLTLKVDLPPYIGLS